jgi:hypothetical protein
VKLTAWWNGAAADRLLDERHAGLVERLVGVLQRRRWLAPVEVTFADFGERGSIDVFGGLPSRRAVAVFEVKTDIGSLEETNRILDVKERLAPRIAASRFGWRPAVIGRILVLPDDLTLRRLIARHERTMRSIYPAGSREVERGCEGRTGRSAASGSLQKRDIRARGPADSLFFAQMSCPARR